MPYCRKCGTQLAQDAKTCPSCGAAVEPLPTVAAATASPKQWVAAGGVRTILLILGAIITVGGILFLAGGVLLLSLGGEGFRIKPSPLETETYAIVLKDINVDLREASEDWGWWRAKPSDFATIKLAFSSEDASKKIFIGIAQEEDVEPYLADVQYDEMTEWSSFRPSPFRPSQIEVEYERFEGGSPASDPASQQFWTASAHGSGTVELDWEPETGNYWVVLMNEDASAKIDATATLGIKIPFVSNVIGGVLLTLSLFGLGIGALLIYLGVRK